MTTILFQGDSITDAGRNRSASAANSAAALGGGYPVLAASQLLRAHPDGDLHCFNRGVSGDKVPDLAARWERDTLALKPDLLSVLVGVNDYWHKLLHGYTGTVAEYEQQYVDLLDATRHALPSARLVVLEPFVLVTGAVTSAWLLEFGLRRAAASHVATRAGATFVPLQDMFTKLAQSAPASYWLADGVHPTLAGHAAIAERWREVVGL